MMTAKQQFDELKRGSNEILSEKDLLSKLERAVKTNKPLVIKAGFDPTAPDLHLGHTVVLQKMRQFQKLGHKIVFLIGDFTGLVGDPSGKSKTRPQLTREQILVNVETYKKQVYKILDAKETEIRFNSEWLEKFDAYGFVKLAAHANVARMLEREDFNRRYKEGNSISLHEFIYPLLQAYDSVALKADVEMGGSDQKFNLLMGRELMRDYEMEPQVCFTMPLLEGLDGVQKMSKSLDNYVGIDETPDQIYGKLMSLPDKMLRRYYDLLSDKTLKEIDQIFADVESGKLHPKKAKSGFAMEIVARYHSEEAARQSEMNFEKIFAKKELPTDLEEFTVKETEIWLPKLLVDLKFAASTSEGKRLVGQGGVKIDEAVVKTEKLQKKPGDVFTMQCGKRRFAKVRIG